MYYHYFGLLCWYNVGLTSINITQIESFASGKTINCFTTRLRNLNVMNTDKMRAIQNIYS